MVFTHISRKAVGVDETSGIFTHSLHLTPSVHRRHRIRCASPPTNVGYLKPNPSHSAESTKAVPAKRRVGSVTYCV